MNQNIPGLGAAKHWCLLGKKCNSPNGLPPLPLPFLIRPQGALSKEQSIFPSLSALRPEAFCVHAPCHGHSSRHQAPLQSSSAGARCSTWTTSSTNLLLLQTHSPPGQSEAPPRLYAFFTLLTPWTPNLRSSVLIFAGGRKSRLPARQTAFLYTKQIGYSFIYYKLIHKQNGRWSALEQKKVVL